jgi:hypothetical protein
MKQLLLLLLLLPVMVIAQNCPTPNGNSIIIDSSYAVGSSVVNETNTGICYNNTTTTKITGLQFKIVYDTIAFQNPTVSLSSVDTSQHYLQYYISGGKIAITSIYIGADTSFTYPSGKLFNINFKHRIDTAFQRLTNIQSLTFDNSFKTVAATNKGLDTVLNKVNGGGIFVRPGLKFHGTFANVTGTLTKNLTVGLFKKPKTSSTWEIVKVNVTDINGYFSFSEIIDTTWWNCKIQVNGDTMSLGHVVTTADAQKVNRFVLGIEQPTKFDFHASDVNASGEITITDVYSIFNRIAGRFTSFMTPDVRFFTYNEYNTIVNDSLTNYSLAIPGTSIFTYIITPGIDSVRAYVLASGDVNGTGFHMARLTPIKIINPLNAPNFIIDQTTDYYAALDQIEINLPKLNVEEGNLVNIPVKALLGTQSLGAFQLALKFDSTLLEFKGVTNTDKTDNWLSFVNPNEGIVEWGGVDLTNNNLIQDCDEVVVLQFIAKKPKDQWGVSPIYVTRKFVGNTFASDLSIKPTDGRIEIFKTQYPIVNMANEADIVIYPNPTTGALAIQFNVPSNSQTTIYFVDMLGNKVVNVIDTKMPQGQYRYTADLSPLMGGTYVAVMECDGKVLTSKKVLNNIIL